MNKNILCLIVAVLTIILLTVLDSRGQGYTLRDAAFVGAAGFSAASGGGGGGSYLLSEDFESAGTPAGWTVVAGTPDFDVTTSPLVGAQSARFAAATGYCYAYGTISATSDVWLYTQLSCATYSSGDAIITLQSDTVELARVAVGGGALWTIRASSGGTETSGAATASMGTTYHVWAHYVAGSGANASMTVYVNTSATRPAATVTITTGDATGSVTRVGFQGWNPTGDTKVDKLRVSASSIGDNPS